MNDHSPVAVASRAAQRTAWLLFAPPAVLAGLRWLLQWQSERGPQTTALPLTPLALDATALQLLAPLGWILTAALVLGLCVYWAVRRVRRPEGAPGAAGGLGRVVGGG